jgi:serine/threonine protein kinase
MKSGPRAQNNKPARVLAAPAAPSVVKGARGERYELLCEIGRGGMATVFRALDRTLGRTVALKVLSPGLASDPDMLFLLRKEVLLASRVLSPHVVRVHDLVEVRGDPAISMDWIDGKDLCKLIGLRHLPPSSVCALARDICEGLSAVHAADIVHRDLKPGNLLVDRTGGVLITDFGVARSVRVGEASLTLGRICGTAAYAAPEVLAGVPADFRSDLYSVGTILLYMLSGGTSTESLDWLRVHYVTRVREKGERAHEAKCLALLDRIICTCLQRNRNHRYSSAAEILRELALSAPVMPRYPQLYPSSVLLELARPAPGADPPGSPFGQGPLGERGVAASSLRGRCPDGRRR